MGAHWASAQGISLVFAELKDPVRRKIERYGLARTIEPRHFFPPSEPPSPHSATRPAPDGPRPSERSPARQLPITTQLLISSPP